MGVRVAGFFFFVLLVAIFGLFKPFANLRRLHYGLAALFAFIMIGVTAPEPSPSADRPNVEAAALADAGAAPAPKAEVEKAAPSPWSYDENTDEMRGTVTKTAEVTSSNQVDLQFPYGTVSGHLQVRKRPTDGLSIIFHVDDGQILCHSFSDGRVSVKIDDQPIKNYGCSGSSDGSSEYAFIRNESGFLANLKKSKRVIIEAEFYQQGRQQFKFDTAGLEWK